MRFEKTPLFELDHVYAVSAMADGKGGNAAFYASEARDACYKLPLPDCAPEKKELVWAGPGGVMSMVPIEEKPGEFLAISKFFRLYQWEEAQIIWAWSTESGYETKALLNIPYIHRFDVISSPKGLYFIGCNLSDKKDERDDWRVPGNIFVGRLDTEKREIVELRRLQGGLFQNHGYCRDVENGVTRSLIGCREGVFSVTAPGMGHEDWHMEKLADMAVSDMAMVDIDGDGEKELATIETFHGCYFRVYKKVDDAWVQIFEHPEVTEFYHVVWGGQLCGEPAFIGGCRRGKRQLFAVVWDGSGCAVETIDEDVGPSNVCVTHTEQGDLILSANRETAEAAVYRVFPA